MQGISFDIFSEHESDVDSLLALDRACWGEKAIDASVVHEWLHIGKKIYVLLRPFPTQLFIGYAVCGLTSVTSFAENTEELRMEMFCIHPDARRNGYGTHFIEKICLAVKTDFHKESLYVWTRASNSIAQAFYEKVGFLRMDTHTDGTYPAFLCPYEAAVVYKIGVDTK